MNATAIFIPNEPRAMKSCTLSRYAPIIEILFETNGTAHLGLISEFPRETCVEICGNGFDDRTVKVRIGDTFFFAFLEDLEFSSGALSKTALLP
ncbi:MAG TPA: hypothetical protein VF283_23395 [Bryobacteraceae bacterium]